MDQIAERVAYWASGRPRTILIGLTGERRTHVLDTLCTLRTILPDTRERDTWTLHLRSAVVEEIIQTLDAEALTDPRALTRDAPFALAHPSLGMTRGAAYDALVNSLEHLFGYGFFLRALDTRLDALERSTSRVRHLVVFIPDIETIDEARFVLDRGGVLVRTLPPLPGTAEPLLQFERPTPSTPCHLRDFTARESRESLCPPERRTPSLAPEDFVCSLHAFDSGNQSRLRTALANSLGLRF